MKLIDKVKNIINQHELKPLLLPEGYNNVYCFLKEYPNFKKDFETNKDDFYLFDKYRSYVPRGWYGFSIGTPIIPIWNEIIEQILDLCIENDPNFEIHQIKIKFGTICFYCYSEVIEDIFDIEVLIYNTLRDDALIY